MKSTFSHNIRHEKTEISEFAQHINLVHNLMISVSALMIVSSIVTATGAILWVKNVNITTGFYSSEAQRNAADVGGWMGAIGGIATIFLALASFALLLTRIILSRKFNGIHLQTLKGAISIVLFVISWLPLIMLLLVSIFRFL